jgi:preprotein translocase subunit SecD
MIEGNFTAESAKDLANKINSGALPFKLETKIITPFLHLSPCRQGYDGVAGLIGFALLPSL